jgi:hypothetical protein
MSKRQSSYIVVGREKTGRLVIARRAGARSLAQAEHVVSDDLERFANVQFAKPAVRPSKKTEVAIRKAVREALKLKPLEQV